MTRSDDPPIVKVRMSATLERVTSQRKHTTHGCLLKLQMNDLVEVGSGRLATWRSDSRVELYLSGERRVTCREAVAVVTNRVIFSPPIFHTHALLTDNYFLA